MDCMLAIKNDNRSDSGQVILGLNLTRPTGLPLNPNPAHLINGFFFFTPNPPHQAPAGPVPSCPSQNQIYHFSAQNHKHTNLRFIIFRLKITNTNTNPNTNTNINTNHKHKFQIYDLWFSLSKSQTKHKFQIFYFPFQNHKHKHKS